MDRLASWVRAHGEGMQQEDCMLPRRTKAFYYVVAGPLMWANGAFIEPFSPRAMES